MDSDYFNTLIHERKNNVLQLEKLTISMNIIYEMHQNFCAFLAEKVFQQLEKGSDSQKIQRIIETELCVGYGLYMHEFNSEKITNNIINWWENN